MLLRLFEAGRLDVSKLITHSMLPFSFFPVTVAWWARSWPRC